VGLGASRLVCACAFHSSNPACLPACLPASAYRWLRSTLLYSALLCSPLIRSHPHLFCYSPRCPGFGCLSSHHYPHPLIFSVSSQVNQTTQSFLPSSESPLLLLINLYFHSPIRAPPASPSRCLAATPRRKSYAPAIELRILFVSTSPTHPI